MMYKRKYVYTKESQTVSNLALIFLNTLRERKLTRKKKESSEYNRL